MTPFTREGGVTREKVKSDCNQHSVSKKFCFNNFFFFLSSATGPQILANLA